MRLSNMRKGSEKKTVKREVKEFIKKKKEVSKQRMWYRFAEVTNGSVPEDCRHFHLVHRAKSLKNWSYKSRI